MILTYSSKFLHYNSPVGIEEACCLMPNIIQDKGYYVCTNCGMVNSKIIYHQTRLAFSFEEKKDRQINEKVYRPYGPRTIINYSKDSNGSSLSPTNNFKFKRLAKINRGLINGYERNLWIALPILKRLKSVLNIPDYIAEDAFNIYNITAKKKMATGRSIDALLSASIYCAYKMKF